MHTSFEIEPGKTARWLAALFLAAVSPVAAAATQISARGLVEHMVEAVGGVERLYELRDVEYEYVYRNGESGKADVSVERYVFDGEMSWAKYLERNNSAFPAVEGELVQGYDGKSTWATLDGEPVTDPQMLKVSDFLRKTNYYWFTMMFKMLDPGVTYEFLIPQEVAGIAYHRVKIGFEQDVGDVQDTYVLYIHPETYLVDRFLFTVLDFGLTEPHLMLVEYADVDGLKLPVERRYVPADWDGNVTAETWDEEISRKISFDNGFARQQFEAPR